MTKAPNLQRPGVWRWFLPGIPWDTAHFHVEIEGPITASHDLSLDGIKSESCVAGYLRVRVELGSVETLNHGSVKPLLDLLDGADIATVRGTLLRLMADKQTTWMGFWGPGDLERFRLRALLEAGSITQARFDRAYADTLEVVTGAVEKKDD